MTVDLEKSDYCFVDAAYEVNENLALFERRTIDKENAMKRLERASELIETMKAELKKLGEKVK